MDMNTITRSEDNGPPKKKIKTSDAQSLINTPKKMQNVGQILDVKVAMVAQLQTKLDGLMAKKNLITPTIKLASPNIEQCQVDLEIAMDCMDGMKNDIENTLNDV